MKAAIYARVSTSDQNCEMQLRELREYLGRRGWDPAGEYIDAGFSGAKTSRPQLDRLMVDARACRFDAVVVWKLDRWGRSLAHLVQSVQELSALGIRFVAVTQNIDTDESNPMARLLLHLMGAFAEFERELIRDRVNAGIRNARARGKKLGRPRRVFRRDEALEMRAQGKSWRAIAAALNVPLATLVGACSEKPPAKAAGKERKQRRVA
jgi:putative DNA-invertase from lambdoid prophage Rac